MKKFIASAALGTVLLTGGAFANLHALDAAASFGTAPAMYTNIVNLGNGLYRADIICENLSDICFGGYHIDIGSGWSFVMNGSEVSWSSTQGCNQTVQYVSSTRVNSAFLSYEPFDLNGTLISIYLNKTSLYSPSNATVNINFGSVGFIHIAGGGEYSPDSIDNPLLVPEMTASYEYRIGDVNGNNKVTSVDASLISVAISNNNDNDIDVNGENIYFPNAIALEVADVDRDGYITAYDAQYALSYYAYVSGDLTPVGTYYTGEWDIYEVYSI